MAQPTIAAIATAPGRGGVAVIRISGPDAFAVAREVAGELPGPGRFRFRRLDVDDVLVLAFQAPNSYTGEDVVEIHTHGGEAAPRAVLERCFAAGARLAEKGEFTLRAFLNGKMDLSEAEAVIELVDAKTVKAAADARSRLQGERKARYLSLYHRALELGSEAEHSLDLDEGELPPGFMARLDAGVTALKAEVGAILARAHEGHILREGALVVLAGPPNSGKSSLMNALLGTSRAIVSDIPGTTRDSIEEYLDIGGYPVRLVDTAGLRDTADVVEREGVRRARELIAQADFVIDLTRNVHTKCDLGRVPGRLNVSAVTGEGLEELKAEILRNLKLLPGREATPSEREASLLGEALHQLEPTDDPVILANRLRDAGDALGRLTGSVYSDDLLAAVFSRFCVGK